MTDFSKIFIEDRGPERIAKRLARAGLCSRREAEQWIAAGRVEVDGKVLESPAITVTAGTHIRVDGRNLPGIEPPRLWRFHKPRALVTTNRDPEGRKTVFDALPEDLPRVVSVGRLDFDTEGLLLLTNDGELSRVLELPATGWLRKYRVRVYGTIQDKAIALLREGPTVDGVKYAPATIERDIEGKANTWLTLGIREGKNREIRKLMEHVGLQVNRLIRISYGPFQLGDLPAGGIAEVRQATLKEQLGLREEKTGTAKAKAKKPFRGSGGTLRSTGQNAGQSSGGAAGKTGTAGKSGTLRGRPASAGRQDGASGDGRQKHGAPGHGSRKGAAAARGDRHADRGGQASRNRAGSPRKPDHKAKR